MDLTRQLANDRDDNCLAERTLEQQRCLRFADARVSCGPSGQTKGGRFRYLTQASRLDIVSLIRSSRRARHRHASMTSSGRAELHFRAQTVLVSREVATKTMRGTSSSISIASKIPVAPPMNGGNLRLSGLLESDVGGGQLSNRALAFVSGLDQSSPDQRQSPPAQKRREWCSLTDVDRLLVPDRLIVFAQRSLGHSRYQRPLSWQREMAFSFTLGILSFRFRPAVFLLSCVRCSCSCFCSRLSVHDLDRL